MNSQVSHATFIVGCPRSGTTLLQSLLSCSGSVSTLTESHFFSRGLVQRGALVFPRRRVAPEIHRFWQDNSLPINLEPRFHNPMLRFSSKSTADAYRDALLLATQLQNKSHLLEKTPRHLHFIPAISASFARKYIPLRFVHLLRDGVDVVASIAKASSHWSKHYGLAEGVSRWQNDMRRSEAYFGQPNHVFSTYERLVLNPEHEALRLAQFCGLPLTEADLSNREDAMKRIVKPREVWKSEPVTGEVARRARESSDDLVKQELKSKIDQSVYLRMTQKIAEAFPVD